MLVNGDDRTNGVGDDDDHRVDVVAVKLDDQVGPHRAEDLRLESQVHGLGLPGLDDARHGLGLVRGHSLRLLILLYYLESGPEVVFVDDLDLLGLCMPVEAGTIFKEIHRSHPHFGNKTLCFDGNCEHVLPNTLEVNDQDHVVHLWEARDEFNLNLCLLVFLQLPPLVLDDELWLGAAAISRDSNHIVDVDL